MLIPVSNLSLLPELDAEFVAEKELDCEVVQAPGEVRIIFHDFPLSPQYAPRAVNLMIRLPAGYPNANPDMFWTSPDVRLVDGRWPLNADYHDPTAGGWQRWSRHDNGWRAGTDNLRTKLASVRREIEKGR